MFEYEQDIVSELLESNPKFQRLYDEHADLKNKVRDAELGILPLDDLALVKLKKQKLLAKDKMAHIIERHRHEIA